MFIQYLSIFLFNSSLHYLDKENKNTIGIEGSINCASKYITYHSMSC